VRKNICIVDDEPEVREVLKEFISSLNPDFKIFEAVDGHDAMRKAEQQLFDLVLTDLNMPHMKGDSLIKHLYRLKKELIPKNILVLSAFIDTFEMPEEKKSTIRVMAKPFNEKILADYLSKALKIKLSRNNTDIDFDLKFLNPFIDSTIEVLGVTCGVDSIKENVMIHLGEEKREPFNIASIVTMSSPYFKGSLALCFPKDCFLKIYKNMTTEDHQDISVDNCDGASELCNQILGNAKAKLNERDLEVNATIPTVTYGEKVVLNHLVEGPVITISFDTDFGPLHLEAVLRKSKQ
jgi:chemotaxis protein CheX